MRLISCIGVRHDLPMLPHFLRHYLGLGVPASRMHLILNAPIPEMEEIGTAASILEEHGVAPAEIWIAPYTSDAMWQKRRELQRRVVGPDEWVLSADVDELHEYPDDLQSVLRYCDRTGVTCVQGPFIDRISADGRLATIRPETSIWEQFPVEADVICTIRGGAKEANYRYGSVKIMVSRGYLLPDRGGHAPMSAKPAPRHLFGSNLAEVPFVTTPWLRFAIPTRVHHFKWVDSLVDGLRERLQHPGASSAGRVYGNLLLDHLQDTGRLALADLPVRRAHYADRVPWRTRVALLRTLAGPGRLARSLLNAARPLP